MKGKYMWAIGYLIGVAVGAAMVLYSVIYDLLPGMIAYLCVAVTLIGCGYFCSLGEGLPH